MRALQSHEKIINTWLSAGETTTQIPIDSEIDRKLPNANTLFEIYGDTIFEASLIEKSSHDQGRAIAISILCKIVSKWQYRESISNHNLSIYCACLRTALGGDVLAAATALYHMEPVLVSGHIGIICLVIPVFGAILRFIPTSKTIKSPLHGVQLEDLRMCCYRLLSLIYCYFDANDGPLSLKLTADQNLYIGSFKSPESAQSSPCFACFATSIKNPSVFLKASHLDTLLASIAIEDSHANIRFLLNSASTVLFSNHLDFPDLFPFLVQSFEELLLKPPTSWPTNSLVDTQITIVRILEQWSRIAVLPSEDSTRLCSSLINLTVALHSKNNLSFYFRLIISIYESVFSWLSVSGSPFSCVSSFISVLVKFMNVTTAIKPNPANTQTNQTNQTHKIQPQNQHNSSVPTSPTVYGMKTHKSLAERVFTLEFGNDDPRPSSLSPTLEKGVNEIFLEYTDSTLQRLIGLLLQEQINSNYPVTMNSSLSDLDDCGETGTVKYFTLSSSIIIGFTDKLMFVRNSIGKFTWSHEYQLSKGVTTEKLESSSVILDQEPVVGLVPFSRRIVVTEPAIVDEPYLAEADTKTIILNESNWIKTLENNKKIAEKITPILKEVQKHLKEEIIPSIPLKSRINRVQAQPALSLESGEILSRLLITHLGFLNSSTQALVGILSSDSLPSDLRKLDELSARENIIIPVYCDWKDAETSGSNVSKSFEYFVSGLGPLGESSTPIFADSSLQVTFPIISEPSSSFNETVSVIWSEDSETIPIHSLPPLSPSNLVHLLISPILVGGIKGQFFRIRILLAKSLTAEYNSIQSLYNVIIITFSFFLLISNTTTFFLVFWPSFGWYDC